MQDFTRANGRLRRLPMAARLVYSIFLFFTLVGLAMTAWLAGDMLGPDLSKLHSYYRGEPGAPVEARGHANAGDGPQIDVPPEAAEPPPAEIMPLRKLLEVTHFHLFSMPVFLMVLSHLFMLAGWSEWAKVIWIGLGTLSVVSHLIAPWLVRGNQALGPAVYAWSGALMALAFVIMAVVPLWEMWAPAARPPA
jgi:hypothetical protein